MSGRMPDVDLVLDFLNSGHVHVYDEDGAETHGPEHFATDASTAAWLRAHGLPAAGADAGQTRRVRDALLAAVDGDVPAARALAEVPLQVLASGDGTPTLGSPHPLGPVLVAVVAMVQHGGWDRVKRCAEDTCRVAFYDESRNRSAKWCSMAVCGNRNKTRTFRARRRSTARTRTA